MSIQYTADQLQRKFRGAPGSTGFSRLADVLRTEGRVDEAIQMCQEGLRLRPNTLSGYVVLGKALMDASRIEEARDQFESALRLDPRCLSAMHFLARIMTKLEWAEAAAGYYRSILEVEPWDAQIRALLAEASPQSAGTGSAAPGAVAAAASLSPFTSDAPAYAPDTATHGTGAPGLEEDTFHKPEGFSGDVMEVNLNDVAADFLPGQDGSALGMEEESLEDALSASQEPAGPQNRFQPPSAPEPIAEPRPLDVLKDDAGPSPAALEGDAPPISGQDVEDRLDSLFGMEDDSPTTSMRDASATWSPAPAEAPAPEIPSAPDFSIQDPTGSATATGEMRSSETGEMPIRTESDFADIDPAAVSEIRPLDLAAVPDLPKPGAFEPEEIPGVQDFSAVDFETPLEQRAPADADAFVDRDAAGADDRVHGEDIERRLDELFNLTEEDNIPPTETSTLPVAPGPKMGEAVSLGDVVSFGGDVAYEEPSSFSEAAEPAVTEEMEAPALAVESDPAMVTGQDVADKLDNLFGTEQETQAAITLGSASGYSLAGRTQSFPREDDPETAAPEADAGDPFLPSSQTRKSAAPAFPEPKPWPVDDMESAQPLPSGDVMSTESMLPPGWFGDAGDGPRITGADVEAQLDKLFHIEEDGETLPAAGTDQGNADNTQEYPDHQILAAEQAARPMPGDEADLTVMMPAMRDPAPPAASTPKDTGMIKDSVADWLARRNEDADNRSETDRSGYEDGFGMGAGDTLILPAEAGFLPAEDAQALADFDATLELPSPTRETSLGAFQDDQDSFDTLAPDDSALLSETTSIEMVDGEDVAGRLDELFADEGNPAGEAVSFGKAGAPGALPEGEMSLFVPENGTSLDFRTPEASGAVSGEDVSSRLQQLFEDDSFPATGLASQPESGVAAGSETGEAGSETDEDMLPVSGFVKPASQPAPELAPMTDEEEGYPVEEEMPSQMGAGANVATVTLAEIYFQQGLREQALQIYRQLLEREPENDSVRKRIEEIEATKPDGGERGPGSDPRRPRPGLKVPKRKK